MAEHGTKFIEGAVPAAVEKLDSGRKKVTWTLKDGTTAEGPAMGASGALFGLDGQG